MEFELPLSVLNARKLYDHVRLDIGIQNYTKLKPEHRIKVQHIDDAYQNHATNMCGRHQKLLLLSLFTALTYHYCRSL